MTYEIEGLTGAKHTEFFGPEWYEEEEVTEEEIRETAWNLCKKYDLSLRRRDQVLLVNFVSTELEMQFGEEAENYFRDEWLNEVGLFCRQYGYT
jgi:hypothetical protein